MIPFLRLLAWGAAVVVCHLWSHELRPVYVGRSLRHYCGRCGFRGRFTLI